MYKITEGNGKSYQYLKDDAALEEYRKAHSGKKYIVNRLKGLGEMSQEEVSETLMDPTKRIIRQISVQDDKMADKLFKDLMGDMVLPRKKFLKAYSEEAMYNGE